VPIVLWTFPSQGLKADTSKHFHFRFSLCVAKENKGKATKMFAYLFAYTFLCVLCLCFWALFVDGCRGLRIRSFRIFWIVISMQSHMAPLATHLKPPTSHFLNLPLIFFKFSESENMKEGHHKKWKSSYGWKFVVYPQRQRIMPDWFLFKLVLDSLGCGEVSNVRWSVKTEDTEIDFLYEIENFGGGFHCHYGQLSCPQTPKRVPQKFGPSLE